MHHVRKGLSSINDGIALTMAMRLRGVLRIQVGVDGRGQMRRKHRRRWLNGVLKVLAVPDLRQS